METDESSSEFEVRVVKLGEILPIKGADRVEMTWIGGEGGYPVVIQKGLWHQGDLAVFVPATAVVPRDDPRWAYLVPPGDTLLVPGAGYEAGIEIEVKRMRGVVTAGVLTKPEPGWVVGQDVAAELRITRAVPPEPELGNIADPGLMPVHSGPFGLRKYPHLFTPGEPVYVTEKINGDGFRACWAQGKLWVGSRTAWKDPEYTGPCSHWWDIARWYKLEERLRHHPNVGIYGEAYGDVAGMKYGATSDLRAIVLFDAIELKSRAYYDVDRFRELTADLGLKTAPELYRGPYHEAIRGMAEGATTMIDECLSSHVREGIVIRPMAERRTEVGRITAKLHGDGYNTRPRRKRETGPDRGTPPPTVAAPPQMG